MSLAAGSRVGAFEVIAPLGAGGMGEVVRARDTRLGREVAIKALPEGFARDPERLARFEREAQLLASLNHPNIAAIYGLEESGGRPHLVLELVGGESLAERLARGPLPLREALEVGTQLAAAIEAAHERGIVHRDLKPANVMLNESRSVKVLDFGLAESSEAASDSGSLSMSPTMAATGAGVILGTAAYMSPEQARGQAVDRRTDVWAFGCVLYECLAGRAPFAAETASDMIARILEREPDWDAMPPAAPARLRELVRRCLQKAVADRPRDIGDLRLELVAIASEGASGVTKPPAEKPSLAVLYFENASRDPESEYFCEGVTEDLLTDLSKIRGLRVASRNAVARYRGAPADIARVGAELKVGAVLEGTVRRSGDRVRITAQLIHVADGFQLWAERYDRTLQDVFAVQEELASAIAEALRVALSPAEVATIAKERPADAGAYDLYLKGRKKYGEYNETSLREALALFEQAAAIDPNYALAFTGIADCWGQLCQWGQDVDVAAYAAKGLEVARHAIQLDPRSPQAYKAESLNLGLLGERDAAFASLHKALEVDPRFGPALINCTVECVGRGDLAGAERYVRRAIEADPANAFALHWLQVITLYTRREAEAIEVGLRVGEITSESFYVTSIALARITAELARGDVAAAERTCAAARADGAREVDLHAGEAAIAAQAGRTEEARRHAREIGEGRGVTALALLLGARVHLRLGDVEAALAYLRRPLMADIIATIARLDPSLHGMLDRRPLAPRRRDSALIWPLEAPMLDPAVHRVFREVKIESGRPDASDVGAALDRSRV